MIIRALTAAAVWLAVALLGSAPLFSQERPDFSGEWLLETPSDPPPDAPRKLVITHGPSAITVVRTFAGRTTTETHRFQSGGTVGATGNTAFTGVMWFGDRLMFHEEARSGARGTNEEYFERGEDWWLNDEGLLTVEITTRKSGASRSRVTLEYARQSKLPAPRGGFAPR